MHLDCFVIKNIAVILVFAVKRRHLTLELIFEEKQYLITADFVQGVIAPPQRLFSLLKILTAICSVALIFTTASFVQPLHQFMVLLFVLEYAELDCLFVVGGAVGAVRR